MSTEASQPDGSEFPWAQDLDDVWHHRPASDGWERDGDVQAHGICGAAFASVHVSSFQPDLDDTGETLCAACLATGAQS